MTGATPPDPDLDLGPDPDLDLGRLRALSAVVAEGTFEAAARALHLTPSALSQRIKALESATGQVLLVRSKPVVPTDAGHVLLRLARQVEVLAADAAEELRGQHRGVPGPPTVLPIAVNADSLATWVLPAVAHLADRYCFDLRRADQEHTAALLRTGAVMAAVTADAGAVAGCSATSLGAMTYRPLAAPGFAARWFPDGPTAEALQRAPVVVFDRDDDLQHRYLRRRGPRHPLELPTGSGPPTHHVPASADFLEAVRLGMGWGMLPDLQSQHLAVAGALVELDDHGRVDVPLYWQRWKLRSTSLDAVTTAVVDAARAALTGAVPGPAVAGSRP